MLLLDLSLAGLDREVGLGGCNLRLARVTVHGDEVCGVAGEVVVVALNRPATLPLDNLIGNNEVAVHIGFLRLGTRLIFPLPGTYALICPVTDVHNLADLLRFGTIEVQTSFHRQW